MFLILQTLSVLASCPKSDFSESFQKTRFSLQALPYDYYQLEPVLWAQVVYFHHTKQEAYLTQQLNSVISASPAYKNLTLTDLLRTFGLVDKELAKYAGGVYNHRLFWWSLVPTSCNKNQPTGRLFNDIVKFFGSFQTFQYEFERRAVALFGSGWIWLCLSPDGNLAINGKSDEFSPLGGNECLPFLGIDLWEHAYELNYQFEVNRWVQYWWQMVDWELVGSWYEKYIIKRNPVPV